MRNFFDFLKKHLYLRGYASYSYTNDPNIVQRAHSCELELQVSSSILFYYRVITFFFQFIIYLPNAILTKP